MEHVFELEDGCGHGQQITASCSNRECHSGELYFTEHILKVSSDQLQANLRKEKHFLTTWWNKKKIPFDPFRTKSRGKEARG